VVFGAAAAWFLYNILAPLERRLRRVQEPPLHRLRRVAVLSFKCVPDFLGVRGACALVLIGASPFLRRPPTWSTPTRQRLFMVSSSTWRIALAIWLGAQPWRLRDFFGWLFARPAGRGAWAGLLVAYGILLCGVAFTLR
jgi:hypothetical protein